MKKNESENESDEKMDVEALINHLLEWNQTLEYRVIALEGEIEAMQRGDNTGEKHKNDGGWFD